MKVQKFRDFQVGDDWVEWLNLCIELLGLQKECAYLKKSILFVFHVCLHREFNVFNFFTLYLHILHYFDISIRQTHPKYIAFI